MPERILAVALVTAAVAGAGLVLIGPAFLAVAVQVGLVVSVLGFGAVVLYARFQTFNDRIERGTGSRPSLAGGVLALAVLVVTVVVFSEQLQDCSRID